MPKYINISLFIAKLSRHSESVNIGNAVHCLGKSRYILFLEQSRNRPALVFCITVATV